VPRAEVGFPTADQGFSSIQGTLAVMTLSLQCFDTVGWAAGRASGL